MITTRNVNKLFDKRQCKRWANYMTADKWRNFWEFSSPQSKKCLQKRCEDIQLIKQLNRWKPDALLLCGCSLIYSPTSRKWTTRHYKYYCGVTMNKVRKARRAIRFVHLKGWRETLCFFRERPTITRETARSLRELCAKLVSIDETFVRLCRVTIHIVKSNTRALIIMDAHLNDYHSPH